MRQKCVLRKSLGVAHHAGLGLMRAAVWSATTAMTCRHRGVRYSSCRLRRCRRQSPPGRRLEDLDRLEARAVAAAPRQAAIGRGSRANRHVVGRIYRNWPTVEIMVRGDSHFATPEVMDLLEEKRCGYIFGLIDQHALDRDRAPLERGLTAMGIRPDVGMGVIRFSLGRYTAIQEIDAVVDRLTDILAAGSRLNAKPPSLVDGTDRRSL